jgi:hypothetical protein
MDEAARTNFVLAKDPSRRMRAPKFGREFKELMIREPEYSFKNNPHQIRHAQAKSEATQWLLRGCSDNFDFAQSRLDPYTH